MDRKEIATVDDLIEILKKVSASGYGDYYVGCNDEYWLARKGEIPRADHDDKSIDMGGHM